MSGWRPWAAAGALVLPVAAVHAGHLLWHAPALSPTGFLQYDQPYYMANAREHWDDGFHPLYGLPASHDPATPRVYVQLLSLALGTLHRVGGLDPGAVYAAVGLVAAIVCLRLLIALWATLFGFAGAARRLAFLLLCWGGGVLVPAGLALGLLDGRFDHQWVLRFDPVDGFWFLNFGRNLYYTTEAFYHALVVAVLLMLVRRRFAAAVLLLAALSASHPFTGMQTLLFVLAWSLLEQLGRGVPRWFPAAVAALLAAHLGYYVGFLNTSAEHRAVAAFWKIPWLLEAGNAIFAYLLVGVFVYLRLRDEGPRAVFAAPHDRMWAVWAAVSFGLANHELLIEPHQPLHFTRGYIWTPLFLLGAPRLIAAIEALLKARRLVAVGLLAALFWTDNAYWFGEQVVSAAMGRRPIGLYLADGERALMRALNGPERRGWLVVGREPQTLYWVTVYTPLRAWLGHAPTTPWGERRWREILEFFGTGTMPAAWRGRDLLIVADQAAGPWFDPATMRVAGRFGRRLLIERPAPD